MKDTIYHSPGCDLTDEQRRFVLDHLRARAEWSYDKVELLRAADLLEYAWKRNDELHDVIDDHYYL